MSCFLKFGEISEYPEFKELVEKSNYTPITVYGIIKSMANDSGDESALRFPTVEELTSYYDSKSFMTGDSGIIKMYEDPMVSERVFPSGTPEEAGKHKSRMASIFGAKNVFVYELKDGTTVVKVAKPVLIKGDGKEDALPKPANVSGDAGIVLLPAVGRDLEYFGKPSDPGVSTSYEDKSWKEPFRFYSGGAEGSDMEWGSAARQLGIKVQDFTTDDYNRLTEEERAQIELEYEEVVRRIGEERGGGWRKVSKETKKGQLVRRDMMQADNADAIFAVGSLDDFVEGGTAYATMRGIILGIPVHFFDHDKGYWLGWDYESKSFKPEVPPVLTQHAAIIGSRTPTAAGTKEIIDTLQRTGRYYGFIDDDAVAANEVKPTKEQQTAIDHSVEFIESKLTTGTSTSGKKFLTIQGMAGTGKTTIVRNIIQKLKKDGIAGNIAVAALSRKAVHVLSSKLNDLGVQTETLYTLAGAKVNESEKQFDIDPNKEKFSKYSIVFVDEASMVNRSIMDAISNYVDANPNAVIVFLGDYGQVRPISDEEGSMKSGVFHRTDIQVETLTERIRQGEDSPILGYADKFYRVSVGKSKSQLLSKPTGVRSVVNDSGALLFARNIDTVFSRIVDAFKKAVEERNPNYIKVVSSTNENVRALNKRIHSVLFPDAEFDIGTGDLIIFDSPYKESAENSTEGVVTKVGDESIDVNGIRYRDYYISTEDGRDIIVKRLSQDKSNIDKFNSIEKVLKERARQTKDKRDWKVYYEFVQDFANISLGYAITIHKAQGSTYDMVVVDELGIRTDGLWENQERAEIMYTALTRSRNITVSISGTEDSGDTSFIELNDSIKASKSKTEEEAKDATPKNRSVRLYIKGQEEKGYFEVVKDFEEGYYSVHFKPTDKDNPKAFSEKEKDILFKAVADVIPIDGRLSTYGTISKGGKHGIERFANLGFVEVGNRTLKMKGSGEPVLVPVYRKVGSYKDGSVSSSIAASLAGKGPGAKPQGNKPIVNVTSFEEKENFGSSTKTVQMTMVDSASVADAVSDIESKIDNEHETTLTVGTRIIPNTSAGIKRFVKSVKTLNKVNKTLLRRGNVLPVDTYFIDMSTIGKGAIRALRKIGVPENAEHTRFLIPTYVVGISDGELKAKEERASLMSQGNFTETELREYAKRSIFKLSDAITKIQSGDTSILDLLGSDAESFKVDKDGNPIDYTKMSRIDILNKIGLGRALVAFVKKPIFEYAAKNNFMFAMKAGVIAKNWDAFLELAYDALINMEGVTLTDAKGRLGVLSFDVDESTGTDIEGVSEETEMEIASVFGSAVEYWQVGFRQVSAFHSLSADIRNAFGKLLDLDSNGKPTKDGFGMDRTITSAEAVSKVLAWTQHATSLNEMISALQAQMNDNPWLRQLVGTADASYTDSEGNEISAGILLDPAHSAFQSQFFSNFRKYFQSYTVTYIENDGSVRMRTVNNSPYEDETLGTLKTLNQNGQLLVWDEEGGLTKEYSELKELIGVGEVAPTRYDKGRKATGLFRHIRKLDEAGADGVVESDRQAILKDLYRAYQLLNIDVPSFETFSRLFSTKDMLDAIKSLGYIKDGIERAAKIVDMGGYFQLFARPDETMVLETGEETDISLVNITSDIKNLLKFISPTMTSTREVVSYEGGKLFYAYVTPSYLGLLVDKLKGYTGEQSYEDFIKDEYTQYEGMFFNSDDRDAKYGPKGHLNYMLSRLTDEEDGEKVREMFEHVTSLTYEGVQYADKTKPQYYASMVSMYLYDAHGKRGYFRVPTMSNKPSEEYFKFERLRGSELGIIVDWLAEKTFYQEINRMRTVADRKEGLLSEEDTKDAKIKNYDDKESEFTFLPFLNKYLRDLPKTSDKDDLKFSRLLKKYVEGKGLDPATNEGKWFTDYLHEVIAREIDLEFENFLKDAAKSGFLTMKDGIIEEVYQIDDMFSLDDYPAAEDFRREVLREFFWNDYFMSINILQLTITDPAMYRDAEDLQKRLAQLHSPGMRPNIHARDIITGEEVSDGKSRYVILKDNEMSSDIVTNLKVALERAEKRRKGVEREGIRRKFAKIIAAFESKKAINFADAQAYSSPTSYRKKMHWFGKWDVAQEEAYKRVISGDYTEDDLDVLWQPLKPFVYTQIPKHSGSDYMPLIKMGIQNKDSEYLLLMADALMRSEGVDSKLGAIYDVMEMSQGDWVEENGERKFKQNGKGIDTFMFESAVKTGITGVIDLNTKTPEEIRKFLWTGKGILRGRTDVDEDYNEIYVHTFVADAYTIQQEVPAHFKGEQQMGSQARIHAIADLPDFDMDGKENTIIVNTNSIDEKGNYTSVPEEITIKEFKRRYQEAIAENIELSFEELSKELGLNLRNRKLRNVILSGILKEEIRKDGRFGPDLIWACDTDANGEFNIPLSDPVQSGRIQQLLNSLIKNRINKQEVAGGALVQVSSWGVSESKELGIRFQSKDGKLLYTRKEFDSIKSGKSVKTKFKSSDYIDVSGYDSYEDYVGKNQDKVAYFEAYVSIYDDRLLDYQNADGVIDVQRIEKEDPKLLEIIGYRIPTEGKYSMVPIKIVGFLPRSGEGIMLPADITLLTGSDFDVDKLYIMRRAISKKRDINAFVSSFLKELQEEQEDEALDEADLHINREFVLEALNTPQSKKSEFSGGEDFYDRIHEAYDEYGRRKGQGLTTHVTDRRSRNNNLIIDYLQAVLTSPLTVEQGFSPGNFDMVKEIGYLVAAYDNLISMSRNDLVRTVANMLNVSEASLGKNTNSVILGKALAAMSKMSFAELKDLSYTKVSLLFIHTQAKFHQQNSVAGKLIGVFAQANTSHGFLTLMDSPTFSIEKDHGFTLNGHSITGDVPIDSIVSRDKSTRISEILASLLASSVDAVKDPVLNLFNINMTTVNMAIALVRLGFTLDTIGWFLTTPVIKDLVSKYEMDNAVGSKALSTCINEMMDELHENNPGALEYFENENITTDDLIQWHVRPELPTEEEKKDVDFLTLFRESTETHERLDTQDKIDYQLLGMAKNLLDIANGFRSVTHMTRYNSITSAVGPFIANTYVSKASDKNFFTSMIIGKSRKKALYRDDATGVSYSANDLKKQIADNPIIKSFREYSYALEESLLGDHFIQGGRFGQRVFEEAMKRFPNLSDRTAQELSEFMVSYAISAIRDHQIFDLSDGDSIETTHRRIILDSVPEEVAEAKLQHPDNRFLKVIRTYVDSKTGEVTMTVNMRGREETDIQDIKTGWTRLYREEQEAGKSASENLAFRIVEYNFFRGGFGFSPKTFMRILPSEIKLALPNYIDNLGQDYDKLLSMSVDNLLDQFMLNYGYVNMPELDITELSREFRIPVEDFEEMVKVHSTKSLNLQKGVAVVKQPDGTYRWAVLRESTEYDTYRFYYVDKLGGPDNQGFEINPLMNPWEIKSVYKQEIGKNSSKSERTEYLPKDVQSYTEFEQALKYIISRVGSASANEKFANANFSERLRIMLNFANLKSVKGGSDTFNRIKKLLSELDLSEITEEKLNQLLDERNICR